MNNISRKLGVGGGIVVALVAAMSGMAFAVDPTPESLVNTSAGTLQSSLLAVATAVLPYAAVLIAVVVGWRFVRKVVHF
jgi:hypothetical protein